jgi:hypothetical protein
MRPLSAVERFFERLFERPSARIFRARLHPVQVLRRVERAMERERRVEDGRTLVPDRFTVRLHPTDLAALRPADGLPVELASGALAFARRQGYALLARPRVAVLSDAHGHPGEVQVEARFSAVSSGPDLGAEEAEASRTRIFEVPVARGPRATLLVHDPSGVTRRVVADGGSLTIGRAEKNGLVLADGRASRQHARLTARDGLLILADLDSTNGTRVNGQPIRELAVGAGDQILIGDSTLIVEAIDDGQDRAASQGDGAGPGASSNATSGDGGAGAGEGSGAGPSSGDGSQPGEA